jgi:hypothetical protein
MPEGHDAAADQIARWLSSLDSFALRGVAQPQGVFAPQSVQQGR